MRSRRPNAVSLPPANLSEQRYRSGIDTFLNMLVNQRSPYAARRTAIASDLALISNRLLLYRVIAADQ